MQNKNMNWVITENRELSKRFLDLQEEFNQLEVRKEELQSYLSLLINGIKSSGTLWNTHFQEFDRLMRDTKENYEKVQQEIQDLKEIMNANFLAAFYDKQVFEILRNDSSIKEGHKTALIYSSILKNILNEVDGNKPMVVVDDLVVCNEEDSLFVHLLLKGIWRNQLNNQEIELINQELRRMELRRTQVHKKSKVAKNRKRILVDDFCEYEKLLHLLKILTTAQYSEKPVYPVKTCSVLASDIPAFYDLISSTKLFNPAILEKQEQNKNLSKILEKYLLKLASKNKQFQCIALPKWYIKINLTLLSGRVKEIIVDKRDMEEFANIRRIIDLLKQNEGYLYPVDGIAYLSEKNVMEFRELVAKTTFFADYVLPEEVCDEVMSTCETDDLEQIVVPSEEVSVEEDFEGWGWKNFSEQLKNKVKGFTRIRRK